MHNKKLLIILPILAGLFSACNIQVVKETNDNPVEPNSKPEPDIDPNTDIINVTGITLDKTELSLEVGKTYQLIPTITPETALNKAIEWSSSDDSVASVENGLITAKNAGFATVFAETIDQHKVATCQITVTAPVIPVETKTIAEVKSYIASHTISTNSYGCGVDYQVKFTIKGTAIAKTDLVKTKASYGLDVSYPGKTFLADETGFIACASISTSKSNSLYDKVADYQCKDNSKYTVTGYISMYLGQPELMVTDYEYNSSLTTSYTASTLAECTYTINEFYNSAKGVNYNCAGHGYGKMISLKGLTCFSSESSGSGSRQYNFTDGTHNLRVLAYNITNCVVGGVYDIVGLTSLKNYSPAVIAISFTNSSATKSVIDYENIAINQSITDLKKNKTSQEDTNTKYPNYIESYKNVYKTTGYITTCIQSGNYYVGIRDTYYESEKEISGKDEARSTYKMALIQNENFWNCTWDEICLFNNYADYVNENIPVTVYYVQKQMAYKSGDTLWDIFLIPDSLPQN